MPMHIWRMMLPAKRATNGPVDGVLHRQYTGRHSKISRERPLIVPCRAFHESIQRWGPLLLVKLQVKQFPPDACCLEEASGEKVQYVVSVSSYLHCIWFVHRRPRETLAKVQFPMGCRLQFGLLPLHPCERSTGRKCQSNPSMAFDVQSACWPNRSLLTRLLVWRSIRTSNQGRRHACCQQHYSLVITHAKNIRIMQYKEYKQKQSFFLNAYAL